MASQRILALSQIARHQAQPGSCPASPSRVGRANARRWCRPATRSATTAGRMFRRRTMSATRRKPTSCAPTPRSAAHGRKARGYRSPSWDLARTRSICCCSTALPMTSSLMGADYLPYRARRGDVSQSRRAVRFGEPTRAHRNADQLVARRLPAFRIHAHAPIILPGLQPAPRVMENWLDEFLYMKRSVDWGDPHLHHAPLRDRPRPSHAGAGASGRCDLP